ncbi:MAG: transposase [Clostridia bacterium]|jgi:transposase
MRTETYIRSSKLNLSSSNKDKLEKLYKVQKQYTRLVNSFIEILWLMPIDKIPSLLPKEVTSQIKSDCPARLVQCAGKQASGIVRGLFSKQKKRLYIHNKLIENKQYKKARKLKKIIDSFTTSMPKLDSVPMELDSRFIDVDLENKTSFDIWVTISSVLYKDKIILPVKRTKHFNKFYNNPEATMLRGLRIDKNFATFMFSIPKKINRNNKTVGIDIGALNVVSSSTGFQSPKGLDDIQKKISRKRKGSKAFQRAIQERTNFINWSINQLNLDNVSYIKRENIKNLKKGKRNSKFITAWTYPEIFDKLDRYCEEQNVSVLKVSPTYTSQRCSVCGWTRKSNRRGKEFKCTQCKHTEDADLNASKNIALNLPELGKKERLSKINIKGFYWFEKGKECIASSVQENQNIFLCFG